MFSPGVPRAKLCPAKEAGPWSLEDTWHLLSGIALQDSRTLLRPSPGGETMLGRWPWGPLPNVPL